MHNPTLSLKLSERQICNNCQNFELFFKFCLTFCQKVFEEHFDVDWRKENCLQLIKYHKVVIPVTNMRVVSKNVIF